MRSEPTLFLISYSDNIVIVSIRELAKVGDTIPDQDLWPKLQEVHAASDRGNWPILLMTTT